MPKGVIQDWGLVEFFDPIDTETTQAARNGYPIRGNPIRVHVCSPGVNAINIYMQVNIIEWVNFILAVLPVEWMNNAATIPLTNIINMIWLCKSRSSP